MKKDIAPLIEKELVSGDLAGASLCVVKDGRTALRADYGCADLAARRPMPPDGIFRLYSLTKTVTSAAAMILLERGVVDLPDPVSKYLEGFRGQRYYDGDTPRPVGRECTVRDLLNMTSGLVYPDEDAAGRDMDGVFADGLRRARWGEALSTVEFCNRIGRSPLAFEPGTHWRYGTSADVLGAVVEVASGKPFRQFLKDEIFTPLGMEDTDFFIPAEKRGRAVTIYRHHGGEKPLSPYTGSHLLIFDDGRCPAFASGGAGLFSTVGDYAKFANVLLTGGDHGVRILGRKTLHFMRSNQLTPAQRADLWPNLAGYGYGNLMRVMTDTAEGMTNGSVGEFGWDGWAGTYAAIDPAEKLILLFFISRIDRDTTDFRRRLRAVVYGCLDEL